MKKLICCILILVLSVGAFAGCGQAKTEAPTEPVDLKAFWETLQSNYDLGGVEEVNEDMLDAFYAGLKDLDLPQRVAYAPMMTSVVSEYVLLQCADEDVAKQAAEILQKRVDDQAAGGAWYPESVEAWAKAKVITKGSYVAMIAAGDTTESIAKDFEALF